MGASLSPVSEEHEDSPAGWPFCNLAALFTYDCFLLSLDSLTAVFGNTTSYSRGSRITFRTCEYPGPNFGFVGCS